MAAKQPRRATALAPLKAAPSTTAAKRLLGDVRSLIEAARGLMAQAVNAGLVMVYWLIGARIREDILGNKRADYGQKIVHALSARLTIEYGQGFTPRNLFNILRFAEIYTDPKIVSELSKQLGWIHFCQLIYIDDHLKRDFYAEVCRIERWSTRTLEKKIGGMLYERTALSKKPALLAEQELKALREEDRMTPDLVFRDPYILDFLVLKSAYSEKDLNQTTKHSYTLRCSRPELSF